ncbi:DUF2752 domain-containing protein [Flagellimonas sp.]|uniref:DUF2752 domain-containing protein n=1 Tax=Flagellimonas sp. TaxID=2058762 RepID=UPI003F4A03CD
MKTLITFLLIRTERYMLPCLNKELLGVECPGCGMQRSVNLLLHGEFLAAFKMYPAIYPILAVLLFSGLNVFIKIKHAFVIRTSLIIVMAITMAVSYVFKMSHFFH